eukprot:4159490-Pleurochrysis_carterae.AAC.2
MARSTARVKPSRWKYSLPGFVMPLSSVISSRSRWFSAFSSSITAAIGSASKKLAIRAHLVVRVLRLELPAAEAQARQLLPPLGDFLAAKRLTAP